MSTVRTYAHTHIHTYSPRRLLDLVQERPPVLEGGDGLEVELGDAYDLTPTAHQDERLYGLETAQRQQVLD